MALGGRVVSGPRGAWACMLALPASRREVLYSARWLGEGGGTAFPPSVTQEIKNPNLYLLGSPSLNYHLLFHPAPVLVKSLSPKGTHF